jgi:hypothetical protein
VCVSLKYVYTYIFGVSVFCLCTYLYCLFFYFVLFHGFVLFLFFVCTSVGLLPPGESPIAVSK